MAAFPAAGRASGSSAAELTHDLYARYGAQLHAFCLSRLRTREEAEDAVQTTFMNVFRAVQGGTRPEFEQAWVYRIAQNVCAARAGASGRRLSRETPDDMEVLQEVVAAPDAGGEELIGLDDALASMPENQRRAILLREWQGLSYREIGEELQLSQAAVEMLIFRARRSLAGALEQPAAQPKLKRKVGHGLNLGSVFATIKSLLTGGAAVKAVVLAVAAGTASIAANAAEHTIVHHGRKTPSVAVPVSLLSVGARATGSPAATDRAGASPGPALAVRVGSGAVHRSGIRPATGPALRPAADDVSASPVVTTPAPLAAQPAPAASSPAPPPVAQQPEPQSAPATPQETSPAPTQASPPASTSAPATSPAESEPPAQTSPSSADKGKGKDNGKDKEKSKEKTDRHGASFRQPPVTTTPVTIPVTTATAPVAPTPPPAPVVVPSPATPPVTASPPVAPASATAPAPSDPGKGNGKGNDKHADPAPPPPSVTTLPVAPAPAPVVTGPGKGRGGGNGNGKGGNG